MRLFNQHLVSFGDNHPVYRVDNKQGPAGQQWVLGHIKHFQQCHSWTAPMIFIKKIVHFWHLKKNRLPTDGPSDHPTDGHTLI